MSQIPEHIPFNQYNFASTQVVSKVDQKEKQDQTNKIQTNEIIPKGQIDSVSF